MFDISNPADVKEQNKMVIENVHSCQGLWDYKAILADPEENILGFSMESYDQKTYQSGNSYGVFQYDEKEGFKRKMLQSLSKWQNQERFSSSDNVRGIYIDNFFYLCGPYGIQAYDRTKDYGASGIVEW